MAAVKMENPWARTQDDGEGFLTWGALEPQRTDLFTVDFSLAYTRIFAVLNRNRTAVGALLDQFPPKEELGYFASAVDFSPSAVMVVQGKRHEIPSPYPGMEEPYGQVTVTFLQDANEVVGASKIMAFLRGWRAIVRAGRAGIGASPGEIALDLRQASRSGNDLIPDFRHDFIVNLWRGSALEEFASFTGDRAGTDRLPTGELELAAQWTLTGAWVTSILPNSIAHARGEAMTIRATFAVESLVEGRTGGDGKLVLTPTPLANQNIRNFDPGLT